MKDKGTCDKVIKSDDHQLYDYTKLSHGERERKRERERERERERQTDRQTDR